MPDFQLYSHSDVQNWMKKPEEHEMEISSITIMKRLKEQK